MSKLVSPANRDEVRVNDTLISMVTHLKPKLQIEPLFTLNTPRKRSTSSGSDDMNPIKKLKEDPKTKDIFYIGSPREVRRLRSDLLDSRNTIVALEQRITNLHNVRKQMEVTFDQETRGLKLQQEKDRETITELENQLQSIRKREKSIKDQLVMLEAKYKTYREETEKHLQELQSSNTTLTNEMEIHNADDNNEIVKLRRKVEELQFIYDAAQQETDAYKKFVEELNQKLADKTNLENELELKAIALQRAQMQIKDLEFTKENFAEFQTQCKLQQHKLATYDDVERENQRLREETKNLKNEVHNKLILEEEVHDLKTRLVNSKELEKKYAALQVKSSQMEMYLEEFRQLGRSICEITNSDASLPHSLRSFIERLQHQEINLTSDKIQLESNLSSALHEAKVAKDELDKSQAHISELTSNVKRQDNLLRRMQKKLQLISGERDSYRKQLDSYEKDLTICINPASTANPGATQLQTQHERILGLEKMVDGYRDMVQKLEMDLQNAEPQAYAEVPPIKVEQISRLQDELDKLRNENSLLRDRKDQLEIKLEDYLVGQDKVMDRVVHFAKNPLADCIRQRESDKEQLEEEVVNLKRKIRKLEEGLEASKLGDVTIDHKLVQELKEKYQASELQKQRIKEYCKNSVQEFRNVIYMLLGYKIDKTANNQYKLTSMYAEKSEDNLCFHLNNEGALNLLENEFSSTLEEMVELYLRRQRSIPVFLSALTTDLFSNRTMTKTFDVEDDSDEEDE